MPTEDGQEAPKENNEQTTPTVPGTDAPTTNYDQVSITLLGIGAAILAAALIATDIPEIIDQGATSKPTHIISIVTSVALISLFGIMLIIVGDTVLELHKNPEERQQEKRKQTKKTFQLLGCMVAGILLYVAISAVASTMAEGATETPTTNPDASQNPSERASKPQPRRPGASAMEMTITLVTIKPLRAGEPGGCSGKPDLIAVKNNAPVIVDAKTGEPSTNHMAQVLIC